MPRTRSLRARLLLGILLSLALILGATAWWSHEIAVHESEELFGARLATSARVLDALVARQVQNATIAEPLVITLPPELEHAQDDSGSALGHPYEAKIAFQVWRDDGILLVRSASADERPFSPNVPGFSTQRVGNELYHVFVLHSGNTWIQVAEKDEVRAELIDELGLAVMTPLLIGASVLLLIANLLVIYGLAPLRLLASDIARREPGATEGLDLGRAPRELLPVVSALNQLMQRMRLALERERRFTDAAAHELRTPLAALKVHADNVARARSDPERTRSMARLQEALARTTNLAMQMLAYSRTHNAVDDEERAIVDLSHAVREASGALEPLRQSKHQNIEFVGESSVCIRAQPAKLERLVHNLLDNASRYGPPASTIRVSVRLQDGRAVLTVTNDGEAIPPELRQRVLEPYYRLPGSGSEGSGLGLAIVQEIAAQHGATLEVSSVTATHGTVVTVAFPAVSYAEEDATSRAGRLKDAA